MISRQKFTFAIGERGDTGPPVNGFLHQIRWHLGSDTGQNVTVSLLPKQGDTGEGFVVYSQTISTDKIIHPMLFAHDTGSAGEAHPYAMAGDRLRVKISNDTGVVTPNASGTLYAWVTE